MVTNRWEKQSVLYIDIEWIPLPKQPIFISPTSASNRIMFLVVSWINWLCPRESSWLWFIFKQRSTWYIWKHSFTLKNVQITCYMSPSPPNILIISARCPLTNSDWINVTFYIIWWGAKWHDLKLLFSVISDTGGIQMELMSFPKH